MLESDPPYAELSLGLTAPYFLDPASAEAAAALGVEPGDRVLDLCAAPGGKSLILAQSLQGQGELVVNDRSPSRRERLKKVIADHLPPETAARVSVCGYDAARWGLYEASAYSKILADVPCSSERHLLHSPAHLAQWSENRIRSLALRQFAILASALQALQPNGRLVYSTCALNPTENDGVIQKLFHRRPGQFQVVTSSFRGKSGEATAFGVHILPDRCNGRGPIYYCILQKLNDNGPNAPDPPASGLPL